MEKKDTRGVLSLFRIAVWILYLPVPGVSGTVLIVIFRRPAKDVLCLFDGGKAQGHVARARADDAVRHLARLTTWM